MDCKGCGRGNPDFANYCMACGTSLTRQIHRKSTDSDTRLVLLGTAGGPSLKKARAQPSNALIVNGTVYIIDAGNGVCRQMALAGIQPQALRAVFITHNHSDHVADYGTLLLRSWTSGRKTVVDTYGPPPLKAMTADYIKFMNWDVQLRIADEGRPQFDELVRAHEIEEEGAFYEDENIRVTSVEVPHGACKPSYAFRFETPHRSIVFSGDTSRSDNLVKLAQGADVLVHEVLNVDGVEAVVSASDPGNDALKRHIIDAHTSVEEVGEVARDAEVGKLVLTHFAPVGFPEFDRTELWTDGVRRYYSGEVVVGEDLMEID